MDLKGEKMTTSAVRMAKKELRQKMGLIVGGLSEAWKAEQSAIITDKVTRDWRYEKSQRVSVYLSTDTEVNTLPILGHLFSQGKDVFIPRFDVKKNEMQMVRLDSLTDYEALPSVKWNIKQPELEDPRENAFSSGGLDLVLVPGVAFTKKGERLGHGKGFYDRFLSSHSATFGKMPYTIALAFQEQIVQDLPVTETDITLDEIISP